MKLPPTFSTGDPSSSGISTACTPMRQSCRGPRRPCDSAGIRGDPSAQGYRWIAPIALDRCSSSGPVRSPLMSFRPHRADELLPRDRSVWVFEQEGQHHRRLALQRYPLGQSCASSTTNVNRPKTNRRPLAGGIRNSMAIRILRLESEKGSRWTRRGRLEPRGRPPLMPANAGYRLRRWPTDT